MTILCLICTDKDTVTLSSDLKLIHFYARHSASPTIHITSKTRSYTRRSGVHSRCASRISGRLTVKWSTVAHQHHLASRQAATAMAPPSVAQGNTLPQMKALMVGYRPRPIVSIGPRSSEPFIHSTLMICAILIPTVSYNVPPPRSIVIGTWSITLHTIPKTESVRRADASLSLYFACMRTCSILTTTIDPHTVVTVHSHNKGTTL